jgi:transposase
MAQNFLPCDRDQVMLLPPSLSELVPDGHLARFVIEVVDQLDLAPFYCAYRVDGRGRPAHDPAMMVALLLYCYAVGVLSSRAIERRCVEDMACRMIAANQSPDHVTISRFRARFSEELSELFFKVLALCRQAGMVRVATVAIDSTKLAANASPGANRTYEGLRREAERILDKAGEIDAREDALFGDRRGDELPEELADPRSRAERVRQLLGEFEARERELKAAREKALARQEEKKARTGTSFKGGQVGRELRQEERKELYETKRNLTDPDSGIVRHRGQLIQGYSVQTAVADGQVILATRVIGVSPDHGQLEPTFEQAKRTIARLGVQDRVEVVLADSGYWNTEQIRTIQQGRVRVLVPPIERNAKRGVHPEVQQMRSELGSEEGRQAYRRRAGIVEPVYAQIRHNRGITRVLRRGKDAVQAEIDLIATTHNLLKLFRRPVLAS